MKLNKKQIEFIKETQRYSKDIDESTQKLMELFNSYRWKSFVKFLNS